MSLESDGSSDLHNLTKSAPDSSSLDFNLHQFSSYELHVNTNIDSGTNKVEGAV